MISNGTMEYLPLSEANKQVYAKQHGYGLHILRAMEDGRGAAWSKFPAALSLLHQYDWIWLLDSDTIIMNLGFPVAQYIDDAFDVVVSSAVRLGGFDV